MRVWTISALICTLVACGSESGGNADDTGDDRDDGVGAGLSADDQQRLAELEAGLDGYQAWANAPSWPGIAESGGIHGAFVQIWLTDDALATISAGASADLPVGAIVVKQGYDDAAGASLANLTAMYKVADGDWFFASWSPEQELLQAGRPGMCTGCHDAGQDSVLSESW